MSLPIDAYFDNPEYDQLVAIYLYCVEHEYQLTDAEKQQILSFHLSQWEFICELKTLNGSIYSHTLYTFQCWVFLDRIPPHIGGVSMSETFPLIRIPLRWNHEKYYEAHINSWSLKITMDTLEGLEWHVFSDIWFGGRTNEWRTQALELYFLLRTRIFDLIQEDDLPEVIDAEEYHTLHTKTDFIAHDETKEVGYESDEETHRRKKMKYDSAINLSKFNTTVARVNSDFLVDADSLITSFEKGIAKFNLASGLVIPPAGACDVSDFRIHLFSRISKFNPTKASSVYFDWVQTIIFSNLYYRNHCRKNGLGRPCVPKHIIIAKNPNLVDLLPNTVKDITTRKLEDPERGVYPSTLMRISGDCALHHIAQENADITAALLRENDIANGPIIVREPFSNTWICHIDADTRFLCTSYTHAFIWLRKIMRERNMPSIVRKVDLSQFDGVLFPCPL
jgi:hypothetical protein